ncbi:MAG: c-type cytochrome [Thiobacillus sp.]
MASQDKTRNGVAITLIAVTGLLGAAAAQAQEITRAEIIATTCYTCHGPRGVSPGSIPSINDISAERMVSILQGFRSGTRASTVMGRHASGYTDEEIKEVAEYLGNLGKKGK